MNLDISDEQMLPIVGGAVLQAITTKARDTVLKNTITYLLTTQ